MSVPEHFFDTNILLYLLSGDDAKADAAEALIGEGGHLSVQVLNEFASVATRKLDMTHAEVRDVLAPIRAMCQVHALTEVTHELGVHLAERYRLSIYDGMIAAAALDAGCTTLFSEDMQDGLLIERSLRIRNPFRVT
ncbi:MAG: PIN domain-containing protein [Candidatus Accumulibacter sp.]|uniref:Ribonuclease VapC n=1 Tax=Candidatus Accumulibacter proximus TaxID=2954385 RepID=A0A935PUL4_9PROT|nr:PIN domain-containing protein [Candidatus Accumulibacter proximus]